MSFIRRRQSRITPATSFLLEFFFSANLSLRETESNKNSRRSCFRLFLTVCRLPIRNTLEGVPSNWNDDLEIFNSHSLPPASKMFRYALADQTRRVSRFSPWRSFARRTGAAGSLADQLYVEELGVAIINDKIQCRLDILNA